MTTVITLLILTDISSVYLAKRALTQGVEAAAQRGVRNLDLAAYYRGEYNASRFLVNLLGSGERDPGIPIDCAKGESDARATMNQLNRKRAIILSRNLGEMTIDAIECDGYQISIQASSTAHLPFVLPFINLEKVSITSRVGTFDERKITTNYYGIDIGGRTQQ